MLIRNGASVSPTEHKGRTPLHLAAQQGDFFQIQVFSFKISVSKSVQLANLKEFGI